MHRRFVACSIVMLAVSAGLIMDRTVLAARSRTDKIHHGERELRHGELRTWHLESGLEFERIPNSEFQIPNSLWLRVLSGSSLAPAVQESPRTVADGVYTDAQAMRGAAVYDGECSGCHRGDLGGATGPPLREQRFARDFAGKDLKTLFTKIATTMPRNAPASLGDNVYLDIVAHVLKENGFPAGPQELAADALEGVRVLPGKPKPPPPVGDFSYVEVVGCLTAGPQRTWMLTRASEPVAVPAASTRPSTEAATATPLGTQTFHLLDAMAYAPDGHRGQKMYVRGLLIKLPGEQRMTISSFEMVALTCS
jgi:S-disulfanyl-L-cysteine oxidoreductase SoxD